MAASKIKVQSLINAGVQKVWDCYTKPEHIVHWNFADPSWHCPTAENDMRIGGTYKARMEARDGSFGFDFEAVYTEITTHQHFSYHFGGRTATVSFNVIHDNQTELIIEFDPEEINPAERQQAGWQSILNNFTKYTESVQ
jgi:uncharacterized protein YndB with AHSA1/START domain